MGLSKHMREGRAAPGPPASCIHGAGALDRQRLDPEIRMHQELEPAASGRNGCPGSEASGHHIELHQGKSASDLLVWSAELNRL